STSCSKLSEPSHSVMLTGPSVSKLSEPSHSVMLTGPSVSKLSLVTRGGFRHGRTGQPPGAALFYKTWGAAGALKKKNHLGREAVFYYLSYHCVWNWQIGAPCSCRCLCSLRRCRGQILREKGEGGRGGGAGDSSPLGLPNGTDKGGRGIHCIAVTPLLSSK